MAPIEMRAFGAQMSPIALAATLTGVGVVMLGLLIGLVVLLVRAVRTHKRLLADLEERGMIMAQSQREGERATVAKPRRVLRRNAILPFNSKSGWGTLPSVETIHLPEPQSFPTHYAPPKPAEFVSKSKRLSWPFSSRRASGKAIQMRKIRVPVLSTVIESPKPSPLVPVLRGSIGGESSSPRKGHSRPSSDQSLLQRHPAFRNTDSTQEPDLQHENLQPEPLRRSLTAKPVIKTEVHVRPNRSKSVTEISTSNRPGVMARLPRPNSHARTVSQSSGTAPGGDLPPLPLGVARIKTEVRRRSPLSRSPSRLSISSYESAGSSILATQSSPIMRMSNARVQKVRKRDWRNSMIVGPRPIRDTLTLHGKCQRSQGSIKSTVARFSLATSSAQGGSRSSILTNSSSLQSIGKVKTAESITLSKVSSPTRSPLTTRSLTTPKRKSGSHVTPYGSPEDRRKRSSIMQSASGNHGAPKRQLSQASTQASSTRSSNGNPFQWDPSPMSTGKPSNLKGSPSARNNRGHKRQNCVRISLTPTVHWPRSRSPSPCAMKDIQEESPNTVSQNKQNVGLGFSSTRSLPRPPSTSIFAPDLKINATSIRASLTPSSPTLPMANYDHGPIGSPVVTQTYYVPSRSPEYGQKRMSAGSISSIPKFPSPCHNIPSGQNMISPPPTFALSRPSNEYDDEYWRSNVVSDASSPFETFLDIRSSPGKPLLTDEYDPEQPYLVFKTPTTSPARNFSSPFSTIPEESSVQSNRTATYKPLCSDSPPCSPKSIPQQSPSSAYNLPVSQIIIPEEPLDTIDPSIIRKEAFHSLNSPFDNKSGSIMEAPNNTRNSIPVPTNTTSARSMFEPLLEAAFPSSPPIATGPLSSASTKHERLDTQAGHELPGLSHQLSPDSTYSSPSPILPCSPRPSHALLPAPCINFAAMPTLTPSPCGPRGSPPRPLRSSIQKLRRMNSDADSEKGGRGERRYLRLGRQDSIALPGEESWLDELEDGVDDVDAGGEEEDSTWDEEKGQKLIGDILNDWEEEATILDLQDATPTATPTATAGDGEDLSLWTSEPKGLSITSSPNPSTSGANRDRSSSIWEDGEKFWCSTPPHPPVTSPNKPKQRFLSLSSSPLSTSKPTNKKREFEVAKDDSPAQEESTPTNTSGKEKRESRANNRYRKRSALGISTPNVRIHIHPPSSGNLGTPGSLYDAEGFLRV